MTKYNTLNIKLSNYRLNKLKSGIKNGTQVISNLVLNAVVLNSILMMKLIFRINCFKLTQIFENSTFQDSRVKRTAYSFTNELLP